MEKTCSSPAFGREASLKTVPSLRADASVSGMVEAEGLMGSKVPVTVFEFAVAM